MTDAPDASSPTPPRTPFSPAGSPPAAGILDAATVVVVRTRGGTRELLMLRRSAKSPFMPSTLVFPGGRLDAADGPREDAASWEAAARRECTEEAGLVLPAAPLSWFDTWLTPSAEPRRRYLARFFLAEVGADAGDDARADGHETHDERWASIDDHLRAWEAGEADLPPPTLAILLRMREVAMRGTIDSPCDAAPPILPKYVPIDGRHVVVMPHDPEYAALPGDGMPAPLSRLRGLPHRFVRDEARWRPW
jgi:8-oxo-dGTP pyrophosphatase MutT (NUDIX family)